MRSFRAGSLLAILGLLYACAASSPAPTPLPSPLDDPRAFYEAAIKQRPPDVLNCDIQTIKSPDGSVTLRYVPSTTQPFPGGVPYVATEGGKGHVCYGINQLAEIRVVWPPAPDIVVLNWNFLDEDRHEIQRYVAQNLTSGNWEKESYVRSDVPATQPVLKEIDVHTVVPLSRIEIWTTIYPNGLLRSTRTDNKRFSNLEKDVLEQTVFRRGQLTQKQIDEVTPLFKDWDSLAEHYGGAPDGPTIHIFYDRKSIEGGSDLPKQVTKAIDKISQLADSMPTIIRR